MVAVYNNRKTLFISWQPFLPIYGFTAISKVSSFKDSNIGEEQVTAIAELFFSDLQNSTFYMSKNNQVTLDLLHH